MANAFATPSWTLKEAGITYENNLRFVAEIDMTYSDQFIQGGAKVGDTINVRLPQRFTVSDGSALDVQNIVDRTVPMSLTNQKHVDMAWSCWQQTTSIDEAKARYINPACSSLAAVIDNLAFNTVYKAVYNAVGTPGTAPTSNVTYLQAVQMLTDQAVPQDGLTAVLDSEHQLRITNANFSSFNPQPVISEAFRKGQFAGPVLAIDRWYQSQSTSTFTTGSATSASSPRVNGANQTGSTININGWGSGTTNLKKGDVITIAGVYSVNPENYQSSGRLQRFVITADTSDSTGTTATLPISPSIITSGPFQTVSGSPAASAVVTYWSMADGGTQAATVSRVGLVFYKKAFGGATADLALPAGGAKSDRIQSKLRGVALRMAETWDVQTDQNITRIDTIVGFSPLRQEWAARVQG